ncbi:hypothetical protein [Roseateles sp.]|uniref:hypothetical protein n=1 Tax=Roseateles sp. TaxID=1971397 RepID=UPI002F41089E
MLDWKSEGEMLPQIAQCVLLATPRQFDGFWDICVAQLLVRHEDVSPAPVRAGDPWPTDFYWCRSISGRDTMIVTANGWWTSLANIPLPPGAAHASERGFDYVRQLGGAFVPQGSRS